MKRKKLILRDRVEVRQFEEGLQGSWYSGEVVCVSRLSRSVQYDELLSEADGSKLIENIPVTDAIEGLVSRRHVSATYRGRIRRLPPAHEADICKSKFRFGICVDAWFEDAWWEGVIFDYNDDADERSVFFPDEGDEQRFKLSNLRISRQWDEFSDVWKERGVWILVELARELDGDLPSSYFLKKVWFHLKNKHGFSKMVSEWTCAAKTLWKKHFCESVCEITAKSRGHGHAKNKLLPYKVRKNGDTKTKKDIPTESSGYKAEETAHTSAVRRRTALTSKKEKVKILLPTSLAASGDKTHYPDSGSLWLHNEFHVENIQSHIQRERQIIQNNFVIEPPSHCRRPRSKRAHVCVESRIRSSTIRKSLSLSQDGQESNKNVNLSLEEQEKVLDSTTENDILQRVKTKPSSNGQDGCSPSKSGCHSDTFHNFVSSGQLKNKASCCRKRKRGLRGRRPVDTICGVCHGNGDLIICARCHSSYHLSCMDLKEVPDKMWCCPACFCGICGLGGSMTDNPYFLNTCLQCSREYHVDCLTKAGGAGSQFPIYSSSGTLCSETCYQFYAYLHQLSGRSNPTGVDGVTWTMLKSMKEECSIPGVARVNTCKKLSRALDVIHECFEPSIEPHTKRDLVRDIVFSSVSKLRRLSFHGFYIMALEKDGDIVSVATVRIHGRKVAEMPLIATHFGYRRQGMCRLLVHELEKLLTQLNVERLVLPAISQLRETWEKTFGFQEMSHSERIKLLGYPFLGFHKTSMFQKYLLNTKITDETSASEERQESTSTADEGHRPGRGLEANVSYKSKQNKNGILSDKREDVETFKKVYRRRRVLASIGSKTSE